MTKPSRSPTERRMEYVEITQAEEMPVLSGEERAELIASLDRARDQIKSGQGLVLKPGEIGDWLRAGLAKARQRRRDGV